MAGITLESPFIEFDGEDVSADVRRVALEWETEAVDATAGGSGGTREHIAGINNWTAQVELRQDFDDDGIDDTVWAKRGATGTLKIRKDTGAVGVDNPEYSGSALLESYGIMDAEIGDLMTAPISFVSAGALSRATT